MTITYDEFIASKVQGVKPAGFSVEPGEIGAWLFPFQVDLVRWALARGRGALFCDCGMGKGPMALEWARIVAAYTADRVLILAPLAVAQQFIREGEKFGIAVKYARNQSEVDGAITVTNYERLDGFEAGAFAGVVLDESSILKAFDGATRTQIIGAFSKTPFRLACTATPSPNDFMELGNHAEFLGVMTRAEMLSRYFVHDGGSTQDWRIKGHAEKDFWRWVCSWAVMIRKPSDLGYEDGAFVLPPLEMTEHVCPVDHTTTRRAGMLFAMEAQTLQEQRQARRASLESRVAKCAALANASSEQWLVWCDLNDEGDALAKSIDGAVQVSGSDDPDFKVQAAIDFVDGKFRVLVSKASIFGWGLNLQHCRNMAFVGLSHSYEQLYQTIRREYRFGQTRTVHAHMITSELEGRVLDNIRRKEAQHETMAREMVGHMRDIQRENIRATSRTFTEYHADERIQIPAWLRAYAMEAA